MRKFNLVSPRGELRSDSCPPKLTPKSKLSPEVNKEIQKFIKLVYNHKEPVTKLQILEKLAIRGKGESLHDNLSTRKPDIIKFSPRNVRILRKNEKPILPKLPYGKHENYNKNNDFSLDSIANFRTPREIRIKGQKDVLSPQKNKSLKFLKIQSNKNQIYQTEAGVLVCQKNMWVINSYEKERSK